MEDKSLSDLWRNRCVLGNEFWDESTDGRLGSE